MSFLLLKLLKLNFALRLVGYPVVVHFEIQIVSPIKKKLKRKKRVIST